MFDKDHQLEKLEFALAVSQSLGNEIKSNQIINRIKEIGLIYQEPGT